MYFLLACFYFTYIFLIKVVVLESERDSQLAIILAQSTHKLFLLFLV